MNIEEQVLRIGQVVKLQDLGFDVIKNSSAIVIIKENDTFIVDKEMIEKNIFGITDKIEDMFYSMTIGDIINIIPTKINEYVLDMNREYISYDDTKDNLYYTSRYKFIDNLFDCLVWCIKHKYINLNERFRRT